MAVTLITADVERAHGQRPAAGLVDQTSVDDYLLFIRSKALS